MGEGTDRRLVYVRWGYTTEFEARVSAGVSSSRRARERRGCKGQGRRLPERYADDREDRSIGTWIISRTATWAKWEGKKGQRGKRWRSPLFGCLHGSLPSWWWWCAVWGMIWWGLCLLLLLPLPLPLLLAVAGGETRGHLSLMDYSIPHTLDYPNYSALNSSSCIILLRDFSRVRTPSSSLSRQPPAPASNALCPRDSFAHSL